MNLSTLTYSELQEALGATAATPVLHAQVAAEVDRREAGATDAVVAAFPSLA
jgi:hypothetical protein